MSNTINSLVLRVFSEPLFQSSCQTAHVQGVDEGEFDFITTMFGMNVDQHSSHMVSIIVKGTLFLYHLLATEILHLKQDKMSVFKMEANKENTQPFRVCF